jgi:hypothetical protein
MDHGTRVPWYKYGVRTMVRKMCTYHGTPSMAIPGTMVRTYTYVQCTVPYRGMVRTTGPRYYVQRYHMVT